MTGTGRPQDVGPAGRRRGAVVAAVIAAVVGAGAVGVGVGATFDRDGGAAAPSGAFGPEALRTEVAPAPDVDDRGPDTSGRGAAPDPRLVEAVVVACSGYRDLAARLDVLLPVAVAGRPGAWDADDGAEVADVLRQVHALPVPDVPAFDHDRLRRQAAAAEEALGRWDPEGPVPIASVTAVAIGLDVTGSNARCREVLGDR